MSGKILIPGVNFSGGGAAGGNSLLDTLSQEEANTLPAVDPYLILDDFNEARGVIVGLERVGSKLQPQTGQVSGTYVRSKEVSSTVTKVNGIARISPTACAPNNIAVSGNAFTFAGDVSNLFPAAKPVVIVKQITSDGSDAYIGLMDTNGKVARLVVSSCVYNGGSNTSLLTLSNPNSLDLDLDVSPSNYNASLRVIPMDLLFQASGTSTPSYESMDIDDISMWSPRVLGNAAESTAAIIAGAVGGNVQRMFGDMSDNGQYGAYVVYVWNGTNELVKIAYTKNGGSSWSVAAFTDTMGGSPSYATEENALYGYVAARAIVANNGKAFFAYSLYDATYNYHVKGAYIDLSAGSPTATASAATGADGQNTAGTAGYIHAVAGSGNRCTFGLSGDRSDLSLVAIAAGPQSDTIQMRWFTAGGATYMGSDLTGYAHLYGRRASVIVTGTSGAHRTFLFNSANTSNLSYKYWDEPSTTPVANVLVLSNDVFQHDCRYSGTKAYLLYRDGSDDAPKYISFNTNGTPAFSAVKVLAAQLDVDEYFGLDVLQNSAAQPYNPNKLAGPQIAINPSNTNQVFFGIDAVHPDGLTRPVVVEVRDDTNYQGAVINNIGAAGSQGIGTQDGSSDWLSQTVTLAGERFRTFSIRGYMGGAGSVVIPTGHNITCEIQETTAGLPNGTVVATAINTYAASDVTTSSSGQWMHFRFNTQTLSGLYAVVFKSTFPITGSNKYILVISTGTTYGGGICYRYTAGNWVSTGDDLSFELHSEWIYDLDSLRAKKQRDVGVLLLDSTETSLAWSTNAGGPVFLSRVSAQAYGLSRRLVTGWPFSTVFSPASGATTASSMSTLRYIGYDSHDERLVFSTECGAASSARLNVNTAVASTTEMAEDRSGLAQVINAYTSVTFGNQVLFTSGKSAVFNTTSSKIIHDSGAGSFFDDALAICKNGSPFAIEAEFILNTLPSVKGSASLIASKYFDGNSDPGWLLYVDTGNQLNFGPSGGTLTNTEASMVLTTGTRYVVRVTGDGTTIRIYINGAEASYNTQNTTAYNVESSTHRLCLGNVYNTSVYGLGGELGYFKIIKGASTFAKEGFSNQAAITHLQNLTYGFIGQRHLGQIGDDTADYDYNVWCSFSGGAAVVDGYDMLAKFNHTLVSQGRYPGAKIVMNRASDRNKIAVPGINWQYLKS